MAESLGAHDDLKQVLDTARGLVDQEFQITQRLDDKARNQASLAGAWFAVVQVAAGFALGVRDLHWVWLAAIIAAAVLAAFGLAALLFVSRTVWAIRDEQEVVPSALDSMMREADEPDADVVRSLVRQAQWTLASRRKNNHDRAEALKTAEWIWLAALGMGLVELLLSFLARALG